MAALPPDIAKEGWLGDDPATLGVIGQAYAGLGKVDEARGMSVAELDAAGIAFQRAPADQRDAVMIARQEGRFTISIRDDALATPAPRADTEARAAAHIANGVRQAQTLRDHEYIGWALIKARGWISGARTHRELAPNDIEKNPTTPSDQNLMAQRKLLSVKEGPLPQQPASYGDDGSTRHVQMAVIMGTSMTVENLFAYFMNSTMRSGSD